MAIHVERLEASRAFPTPPGSWILTNLNDVTIVFGRNGAGKSQLLRQLRDQQREQRHYASPERGGEITFNPQYMQEEYVASTRGQRRTGNSAPTYRDEGVARIQAFLARRGNVRTTPIPVSPGELESLMNVLLPAFEFQIRGGAAPVALVRIAGAQEVTGVNQLSSGEAALLSLGLDLISICGMWALDDQAGQMLLLDEPDLHLHPDLQQHLANFVVRLVDAFGLQVIVATHSTTLLAAFGQHAGARASVVYLDPNKVEQNAIPFTQAARELAACLGGHALMGPLFAVPLLLVEGDDDYKVWSQAARYNIVRIAVLPCEGSRLRDYEATLGRLFAAMIEQAPAEPLAFGLHDLDDRDEQPPAQSDYVTRVWLNCREVENLYLTAEVLAAFDLDEAGARNRIQSEGSRFGEKSALLANVATSADWRTVDLKGSLEQLTEILDPKRVDWRIRIGQVIGKSKPSGQLADYLGEQVVQGLWRDTMPAESAAAASAEAAPTVPTAPP